MPSVKNLFNKRGQYPLKRKDSPPIVGEGQGWGQYSENRQSIRQNLRLQTPPLTPPLEGRGVRGIPLEEVWRGFPLKSPQQREGSLLDFPAKIVGKCGVGI